MLDSLEARKVVITHQKIHRTSQHKHPSLKNPSEIFTLHSTSDLLDPKKKAVKPASEYIKQLHENRTDQQDTLKTEQNYYTNETEKLYPITQREALISPSNQSILTIPYEVSIKRPPLTSLDLSNNGLKVLPNEVLQISTLYILKLHHNKLETLPDDIYRLADLEILNLGHNNLKSLPPGLQRLAKLKDLNLESNHLTRIGIEVTNLKELKSLNIVHNNLESFPTAFCKLEMVNNLHFEWFEYTGQFYDKAQKGKEGLVVINWLRKKCANLHKIGRNDVSFYEFVSLLSSEKINLTQMLFNQGNILHQACHNGDKSVVAYLLEYCEELINEENEKKLTPLCIAILQGHTSIALQLLQYGADHRKSGGVHGCPLLIAVKKANLTMIREILKRNEDPNRKDSNMNTALHHTIFLMVEGNYHAPVIARELLERGANPNLLNKEKWSPMHIAARKRSLSTLKWLLEYNFEVENIHGGDQVFKINKKGGPYNWTPLHIAAYSNTPEIVEILAEAGAKVFKRSLFGYSPKNGVNKPGLALKLCQRFEREWVQKFVFKMHVKNTEEIAHWNLKEIDGNKAVRMASKNWFGESIDLKKSRHKNYKYKERSETISSLSSVDQFAPVWKNCQMDKIGEDDGPDSLPRTESSFEMDTGTSSAIPTEGVDQTDVDEDLQADAQVFTNVVPFFGDKARLIIKNKQVAQAKIEKKASMLSQISVSEYKEKQQKAISLDLVYCQKEVDALKDDLLLWNEESSNIIKTLSLLKALHEVILQTLYKSTTRTYSTKEPVLSYIYQENFNKKSQLEPKSRNEQMILFYNLVPEALIQIFKSLSPQKKETAFIKMQICKILSEINYVVGLNFLQQVVNDPEEKILVKREAQQAIRLLMIQSASTSNTFGK